MSGIPSEYPGSSTCVHSFELTALMIHHYSIITQHSHIIISRLKTNVFYLSILPTQKAATVSLADFKNYSFHTHIHIHTHSHTRIHNIFITTHMRFQGVSHAVFLLSSCDCRKWFCKLIKIRFILINNIHQLWNQL